MALRKFRRGETTYTCRTCQKRTRNTGGDEFQVGLCVNCYDLAGCENYLNDNGELNQFSRILAGSIFISRPELKEKFPEVAEAVEKYPGRPS